MTVGNPEGYKFKISVGNEESKTPCDFSNLTLHKLTKWIDQQAVSKQVKEELKKSASRFPHQALPKWRAGYLKHLSKAQAKVREKNGRIVDRVVEELGSEDVSSQDISKEISIVDVEIQEEFE
jgi:hypothetical protein